MTIVCPKCQSEKRQNKDGRTSAGSQRYRCKLCGCRYTPEPKEAGYEEGVRLQALELFYEGLSLREIGRVLAVNHQSVANWINAYSNLPDWIPDSIMDLAELDGVLLEESTLTPRD